MKRVAIDWQYVQLPATGDKPATVVCVVLDIDCDDILGQLAYRAATSKGGKARYMKGAIVARVTERRVIK